MDIHFYVRDEKGEYEVGHALIPVVPRMGESVWLHMSLRGGWALNPANPARLDTAHFQVDEVWYDAYNVEEIEEGMGAAPLHEGSTCHTVQCYVHATNEDTQVYVDRIIASEQ